MTGSELVPSDFTTLMNASGQCVLVHDAATKDILWASPAACALLEFGPEEIKPLKADQMSSTARQYDRAIGRAWLQEAVENGSSRTEWHYRSKSGRVIPTDAHAVRVELAGGPAVVVRFQDIEREQRLERELSQRENHQARYTAMGDMAMAIAHELGQPLAAAANFLAGAQFAAPDARVADGIGSAVDQIERAAAIVRSLRSFVGRLEHVEQVNDLNEIVRECLHFVELRAAPLDVEIVLDLAREPVPVRCERVLTGQVLLNLCFNAIEELAVTPPAGRRITVSTRPDGVCLVDDTGRGLHHDPFAESFTSKEGGSGLGLALSHRIITRQHGEIWAESRPDGGSRFAFGLPLVD